MYREFEFPGIINLVQPTSKNQLISKAIPIYYRAQNLFV